MGKLYIVPTPIGNLEDITLRAINVLKSCDLILAEDTRTSSKLLKHICVETPLKSHHKFNEHQTTGHFIEKLNSGETIALISDAGTPAISDPGFFIVRACIQEGIDVECLPGATAFVPALVVSGLPNDRFCFEGFLPQKKGRNTRLNELTTETRTMIFYESPYRLIKTLNQFIEFFGESREISVSREISKMFEETKRGTLKEMVNYFTINEPKGEFVIIVSGFDNKIETKKIMER